MLTRNAQRVWTRRSLPRPFRLYSSPSKPTHAPVFATQSAPSPEYPAYLGNNAPSPDIHLRMRDMEQFLNKNASYTFLPTPLPEDRRSTTNDLYFTDSPTQDLLAVMAACLHNLHNVPRAKQILERLRKDKPDEAILETRLLNSFLEAYLGMAMNKEGKERQMWLDEMRKMYTDMESERVPATPSEGTYALMLLAWYRFSREGAEYLFDNKLDSPATLLQAIITRGLDIQKIVADRCLTVDEEAEGIIKVLSQAAVNVGLSRIVSELGQAESFGQYDNPLEGVPEVNPVLKPRKQTEEEVSQGLDPEMEVPFNLSNLRRHLAQIAYARKVLPEDVSARQKLLEESVYDVAVARLEHQADLFAELGLGHGGLNAPDLQKWMWDWHTKLQGRLEVEIKSILDAEASNPNAPVKKRGVVNVPLGPFLTLVKAERLSMITILEIMRLQGSGGVSDGMKTARALISVGRAVENEYKAQICKKNNIHLPQQRRAGESTSSLFSKQGYQNLHQRRVTAFRFMDDSEEWTADWTQGVRVKVGSILVECLMDMAQVTRTATDKMTGKTVEEVQPAFYHSYEYLRGQKLGVIKLNPAVAEVMSRANLRETLHPRHLPMLVKPKPWLSPDNGGYIYNKTHAMRFKDSAEQSTYLKQASEMGNVELVYAGLDVLGSTPWQINREVFDVVLKIWNSGERMGKLPPAVFDEPEPEKPDDMETDLRVKGNYLTRMKTYTQAKANNHSDRCNVNYKIEIARAFLGDTFYLPHNLDFRGRAYPIPPHLNHIGDDLSRGLLKFGETKPLGERGLRWLKIHLANLYGYDKASFDERVQWVMERLPQIFDSAEKPLDGERWWAQADDPWQCLATCMELRAALNSPDPLAFESSLPVHQDGTCNGLQHYAALGGDAQGAAQVNLAATDRPSDVYTYVAKMVEKIVEKDAAQGHKHAQVLLGKISRKVVKQTVMTTVYGVTFIGARDQIEKQLKDRKDIPAEDCWMAASYLAKLVLHCIGDLFSGAKAIQTWLNLCARLIARSIPQERIPDAMGDTPPVVKRGPKPSKQETAASRLRKEQMTSVVWTTPLGLPIVQPYRRTKRKQVMTSLQTVYISDPSSPAEVNSQKQATAFPPNFIHSLDATHMMLTALECRNQGLTFASVHDSYWTHACSIDKMSEVIRETFIALHSSDVLGKLHQEFTERYANYQTPLDNIRSSTLVKQLAAAGSRISVTTEQAQTLTDLKPLLEISDNKETAVHFDKSAVGSAEELEQLVKTMEKVQGVPLKRTVEEEDEEAEVDEDEAEPKKGKKAALDAASLALHGKFVDVTRLLPPLPKKGTFEVENIKDSQYFFS